MEEEAFEIDPKHVDYCLRLWRQSSIEIYLSQFIIDYLSEAEREHLVDIWTNEFIDQVENLQLPLFNLIKKAYITYHREHL